MNDEHGIQHGAREKSAPKLMRAKRAELQANERINREKSPHANIHTQWISHSLSFFGRHYKFSLFSVLFSLVLCTTFARMNKINFALRVRIYV